MAKIFLFRHAQTTDNLAHIFSGKRDPDLTPLGIEEAERMRDELANETVTKAYCSERIRSKKTLDIILEPHPDVIPIIDPRIDERDYGNLTGENKDEVAKKFPDKYPLWHRSYDVPPPGGESLKQVEERVLDFLRDVLPNITNDDVVLISASGNSLRPVRRYFEKLSIKEMCSFEHTPGKIYKYEI